MNQKIISVIIVVSIHLLVDVFMLGGMLLAMNGYNDKSSESAIIAYGFVQIVSAILSGLCAYLICRFLQNKGKYGSFATVAISFVGSLIIIVFSSILALGIGIAVGDAVFRR